MSRPHIWHPEREFVRPDAQEAVPLQTQSRAFILPEKTAMMIATNVLVATDFGEAADAALAQRQTAGPPLPNASLVFLK